MKMTSMNLGLACALTVASIAAGQYPYGASDATYGLRSRIAENPSFTYTPSPADWRDVNMYQLFTDRFADGDSANNNVEPTWYVGTRSFPDNRNFHHGGDWKGLKNNLDYLAGMGVKAIWMSGVQKNGQGKDSNYTPYHMYHPTDFFRCDPVMGTFQDLKELIDACHARGIYVILDVVINHTADRNGLWGNSQQDDKQYWSGGNGTFGWWNDGNKHAEPFNDLQYFHNNGTIKNWDSYPEFIYGQFKGTDDLKTENASVQGWLDQAFKNLIDATDCDGFRVDAIKHVEYDWCKQWADNMRKHAASRGKSDFILFGEYFTYDHGTLAKYCKDTGYSFNSALFFPMSQTFKSVFVDNGGTGQLTQQLNQKDQYGEGAARLVTFIDNHDLNRIGLQDGGDIGNIVWDMRPALSFLYLACPVPCLFYGTEHAFQQGGHWNGSSAREDYDDADWQRECMFDRGFQPGPAQGNKLAATDAPLYQHIKALNQARATYKSLTRGSFTERWQEGSAGAYAFSRVYDTEESLVALNTADGAKSINPLVGKPDGTEFVNVLNTGEKVTASGGRISFSLSGKETKVFVAGLAPVEMWVRGTHSYPAAGSITPQTPVYINTEAGPTGTVASVKVGYSVNGGATWELATMTATNWASTGGTWYSARLGQYPAGTVINYYIEIADASANKKWDNNGGPNYSVTVGQSVGVWIRNTQNFPADGDATDGTDLYVNTEAGPSGTLTVVRTAYSTNGTTWIVTNMTMNTEWGSSGGNWYNVNLGRFAAGTALRYYIEAFDSTATNKDDNGGLNYQLSIRGGGSDALWVGATGFLPTNGAITASSVIQIDCESWPMAAATNVAMAYTIDGGSTWQLAALTHNGTNVNNDLWRANMGPYPDGTTLRFAVVAQSAARETWDNNGGLDYRAVVGEVGVLRMVEHTPSISAPGTPDNPGDSFDFDTSGGAATTGGTNGFGSFGSLYVNYDATNLYVGGAGMGLPSDSTNNAAIVFLGGGTNAGSANLWGFTGNPEGIDKLHNAAFQPSVNVAILLGDVWGDGNFADFRMYTDGGFPFGQGVFAVPAGGTSFTAVAGSRLSQFGGYGPGSRIATNWECVIPLTALGVPDAASLTNLYLSGLLVTGSTSNNNRFVSGKYLGSSATLGNDEHADAWGNFAFSFVNLGGIWVLPPQSADETLGVPHSWIDERLPHGHPFTEMSDYDGDGQPDRNEFYGGLNPTNRDELRLLEFAGRRVTMYKDGGQAVDYIIETADTMDPVTRRWNWAERSTATRLDGILDLSSSLFEADDLMLRVRVRVPPPSGPSDSVAVRASPAGGSFSGTNLNVTLSVSGVNVAWSTFTVEGGSATPYGNGDVLVFGAGLAEGQSRTLALYGETVNGVTSRVVYTFTRTAPVRQISGTGNVATDPASGAWDTNETLTVSFQTAPTGAAVSASMVFSVNGGVAWAATNMTRTGTSGSNDIWSVTLGAYPAGTVVQFALEARDAQNNSTWNNNNNNNYSVSVNGGFDPGGSKPYSTNPTRGKYRSAGITIDGANTSGEWASDMLIALDKSNDDPRSLGSNWTMHEAPIDFTHLWACWDDSYVYLAWQLVDVTDVFDSANAGSGDPINRNDGILVWMVLDTKTGGCQSDMWSKSNRWSGANTPDFQIYMAGSLWQSYMSRESGGVFPVDDGGVNYKSGAAWGITHAKSAALIAGDIWGVSDCDARNGPESELRNFKNSGHARTDRDSFYEIKIPMAALGINRAQLEASGMAVMLGAGGLSAMDCIPNDAATTDTPGVEDWNSSKEWADADSYTAPFARIGQ